MKLRRPTSILAARATGTAGDGDWRDQSAVR